VKIGTDKRGSRMTKRAPKAYTIAEIVSVINLPVFLIFSRIKEVVSHCPRNPPITDPFFCYGIE
jgi:hypothetical protein